MRAFLVRLFSLTIMFLFYGQVLAPSFLIADENIPAPPREPERFALVADSLATALFADTQFAQQPKARVDVYARLQGLLGLVANFKYLLFSQADLFRLWQTNGDMNQTFGPYTNRYQSLYHRLAAMRGDGSQVVTESTIISSKVEPESFARHINNYRHWTVRDFSSIIFALGSNDICNSWQNPDQFEHNYRQALQHLRSEFPGRKLYIVSPPHIPRLGDSELADTPIFGMQNLSCRDYFQIITCPAYRDHWRFEQFVDRVRKLAAEQENAVFIDVSSEEIRLSDLSGDCFHPSFAGHARFAEKLAPYFQ